MKVDIRYETQGYPCVYVYRLNKLNTFVYIYITYLSIYKLVFKYYVSKKRKRKINRGKGEKGKTDGLENGGLTPHRYNR